MRRRALVTVLSSGTGESALIYDTFTGANGTLLTAHTPDIGAASWSTVGTAHQIQSNKARANAVDTAHRNIIDSTLADCTITCTVVTGQTTGAEYTAVLFRATDAGNLWQAMISKDATYKFSIVEVTASATTVRAKDDAFVYAANTSYNVTITLSGNSITAALSGGHTGQLNHSSAVRNAVTTHGISSYIGAGVTNYNTFDLFRVTR